MIAGKDVRAVEGSETPLYIEALQAALEVGQSAAAESAIRRCLGVMSNTEPVETVILAAVQRLSSNKLPQADALRAALLAYEQVQGRHSAQESDSTGEEAILLATLPDDRHDVGRLLWRMVLSRGGMAFNDLGVRAPALIARHATVTTTAIGVYIFDSVAQPAVQSLVAYLLRRNQITPSFKVPLLLGGPGVDEAFARWVAVPGGGMPYWGGVYYCEDAAEILQVLKQIVLFEPTPAMHTHEHTEVGSIDTCESCGGCPLAGECASSSGT